MPFVRDWCRAVPLLGVAFDLGQSGTRSDHWFLLGVAWRVAAWRAPQVVHWRLFGAASAQVA
eukprot:5409776-Pyramimonas_sp.AAC.1